MTNIYCGNNLKNKDLLSGKKILGTRYQCLKIGVGKGLNMPLEKNYSQDYEAIDSRKIYCGNRDKLLEGYDYIGNLPQCLQKGIGIGKYKNFLTNKNVEKKSYLLLYLILIYVSLCLGIFFWFYLAKPSFIVDKKDNKKNINIVKFIEFYFSFIILIGICLLAVYFYIKK